MHMFFPCHICNVQIFPQTSPLAQPRVKGRRNGPHYCWVMRAELCLTFILTEEAGDQLLLDSSGDRGALVLLFIVFWNPSAPKGAWQTGQAVIDGKSWGPSQVTHMCRKMTEEDSGDSMDWCLFQVGQKCQSCLGYNLRGRLQAFPMINPEFDA